MMSRCMCTSQFVYPFVCWQASGLFPPFDSDESRCYERSQCVCGHTYSFLLGMHLGVELLVNMVTLCLTSWGMILLTFTIAIWGIGNKENCVPKVTHQLEVESLHLFPPMFSCLGYSNDLFQLFLNLKYGLILLNWWFFSHKFPQ